MRVTVRILPENDWVTWEDGRLTGSPREIARLRRLERAWRGKPYYPNAAGDYTLFDPRMVVTDNHLSHVGFFLRAMGAAVEPPVVAVEWEDPKLHPPPENALT